ncbi:MAG: class I SAM-dependent methyltransferase, partial [Candidatus Paceibacterota bacterium]
MIEFTEEDFKPIDQLKDFPPEHISVAGIIPYIARLKNEKGVHGVEIGTERGESAYILLKSCPNIVKLYTIDPYEEYACWNGIISQEACDKFEEIAKYNLKEFGNRVEMIKKRSVDAAIDYSFADDVLDFVYIDGSDSEEDQYEDF